MQKYQNRSEVPDKYKWNLTDFFQNEEEFQKTFEKAEQEIEQVKNYKNCTKDAQKLYEFLKLDINICATVQDLYVYAYLINDQDLGVAKSIERKNKATDLYSKMDQYTSFFAPELLKLSEEEYHSLFKMNAKLKQFKPELDKIYRRKKHVLAENEERIISELTNAYNNFDDISSNMLNQEHDYGKIRLEDGTLETIANNNYRHLLRSKNRNIRKKAYICFNKKISQYGGTASSLLHSYIKGNITNSKLHHFKNAWDEKLYNLNLSNTTFKNLVETTEKNVHILQNYFNLRKKILGYDKQYYYDTKVNLMESTKEYTIEEAQSLVRNALQPLQGEYLNKLEKIFENHYIDYCQYKGKCSGGYSFATINQDSRIMMNFKGGLDCVSTIAHESGHNVHHQFLHEANEMQYRDQSSIVAEVASLTNECLLSNYIAKNAATKKEKLAGLNNIINVFISNLFGAVREGKIEQQLYEEVEKGKTLTQELIDNLVKESYKKYFGKTVTLDKYTKNSWIVRSHYYMGYYLYSYSISICVASYVASEILNGNKDMLEKYLKFLKIGSDKWPSETFQVLGINLEDKNIFESAITYFDKLVKQYEEIYYDLKDGE